MSLIFFILVGLGLLATLAGGIVVLVAAFRQSLAWGLSTLLVPFAALFFLFSHWREARVGFLIHLAGFLLMVGGAALDPAIREALFHVQELDLASMDLSFVREKLGAAPAADPRRQSLQRRIDELDAQYSRRGSEMNAVFAALSARRQVLKTDDPAAVAAFNADAAEYQRKNAELTRVHADLAARRAELEGLADPPSQLAQTLSDTRK